MVLPSHHWGVTAHLEQPCRVLLKTMLDARYFSNGVGAVNYAECCANPPQIPQLWGGGTAHKISNWTTGSSSGFQKFLTFLYLRRAWWKGRETHTKAYQKHAKTNFYPNSSNVLANICPNHLSAPLHGKHGAAGTCTQRDWERCYQSVNY